MLMTCVNAGRASTLQAKLLHSASTLDGQIPDIRRRIRKILLANQLKRCAQGPSNDSIYDSTDLQRTFLEGISAFSIPCSFNNGFSSKGDLKIQGALCIRLEA